MYLVVTDVKPLADYKLALVFENGERRIFDVGPYLGKGIFRELRDEKKFRSVRVSIDTVEWSNQADIDPTVLYEKSIPAE